MIKTINLQEENTKHIPIGNLKIRNQPNMKPIVDKLLSLGYTTSLKYDERHIFVYKDSSTLTFLNKSNTIGFNEHKNKEITLDELLSITASTKNIDLHI